LFELVLSQLSNAVVIAPATVHRRRSLGKYGEPYTFAVRVEIHYCPV